MLKFKEIIEKCDPDTRLYIEQRVALAHRCIQSDGHTKEYDDITPHLFEEIGDAIFWSVYPDEQESEAAPEVFTALPGELAFYCRRCKAPRVFVLDEYARRCCSVCGVTRVTM